MDRIEIKTERNMRKIAEIRERISLFANGNQTKPSAAATAAKLLQLPGNRRIRQWRLGGGQLPLGSVLTLQLSNFGYITVI